MKLYHTGKHVSNIDSIEIEHIDGQYRAVITTKCGNVNGKKFDDVTELEKIIRLFIQNHNGIDKFNYAQTCIYKLICKN